MRLGACTGFENIEEAKKVGFDYIECALNALAALSEEEFEKLSEKAESFPIPVLKCNCFLPGSLPVTGPAWEEVKIREYLEKALSRAHRLGIQTAVFGSGGSRQVPEGWAYENAWKQLAKFLRIAAEYASKYDMKIAIEPLRREECNIVNLVSEAMVLSSWVNLPQVGVLADTFHMLSVQEPWSAMHHAGKKLMHVHISKALPDLSGRMYPSQEDGTDYEEIFNVLKDMGYEGDISVEAQTADFAKEGASAVICLKKWMK